MTKFTDYDPISCEFCGESFVPKNRNTRFCYSTTCRNRRNKSYRDDAAIKRDQRHARDWKRRNRSKLYTVRRNCEMCGGEFLCRPGDTTRFCGRSCARKVPRRRVARPHVDRRRVALAKLRRVAKGRHGSGKWVSGPCAMCGTQFVGLGSRSRFCSSGCADAQKNYRRQVRTRTNGPVEAFTRREVFERDGWVCGICADPVNRKAVFPDPLSPTVDHIIPLAKGGTHTFANVQCAHFMCNSTKQDLLEAA